MHTGDDSGSSHQTRARHEVSLATRNSVLSVTSNLQVFFPTGFTWCMKRKWQIITLVA
jgi:hypothetical protein